MAGTKFPEVGEWFRTESGELFEVIAADEIDETIEIQYFEGEVDQWDLETWKAAELEVAAEPEDWSGPFDDLEADDLGYTDMEGGVSGSVHSLDDLSTD